MNETEQKLSKDWFRLKRAEGDRQKPSHKKPAPNSAAVPLPTNNSGMEVSDLPPLREALLNADQLNALMNDVIDHATEIRLIGCPQHESPNSDEQVMAAHSMLVGGQIRKLQIRYSWQNKFWIDTFNTIDHGFRLIRIMHSRSIGG